MKSIKILSTLISLSLVMFLFQNQMASDIQLFVINANDLRTYSTNFFSYKPDMDEHVGPIQDVKNKQSHESKFQGNGIAPNPVIFKDPEKSYVEFEINGNQASRKNDRSEIRVKNTNSEFGKIYYSSFRFRVPRLNSPAILNDEFNKDWALIWQCAQIDGSGGANSPPLSLHIANESLSVNTIQDYQPWGNGKPKPDLQRISRIDYDRWYTVLIRYSLGLNGSYAIWLDGQRVNSLTKYNSNSLTDTKYLPIGYKDIDHNSKQYCTVRYGLYKNTEAGNYKVHISDFSFGNVYHRLKDL